MLPVKYCFIWQSGFSRDF